jgi:hypothetical protein
LHGLADFTGAVFAVFFQTVAKKLAMLFNDMNSTEQFYADGIAAIAAMLPSMSC